MSDDNIVVSALFLKRINYRLQELSRFADQLNISAFHLRQLCDYLEEDFQKVNWEV